MIKAASFVHPEIAAAHWKLNSEAVILNIQGFPPSTSSSQACVRETPVVFLSATNPLGRTQMSVEFPTPSGAQSRLSCCEARGLRFLLWCAPVNSHTEWSAVWKAFCKIAVVFQDFIVVCFSKFVMRCFGPSHSMLFAIPQQPSTLIACLVYWPRVVWKTQKKKRMMKKAVLCICCVLSLHVLVSPDSVRLPHSQPPALPPFTSFQWYSPWDKAQGRWAKRNSGESCEEGVALVGTQSGSPACAHDSPSRSSGTSAVRNERNRSDIQKCLCCSEKVWRILHEQQRLLEAAGAALSNNHTIVVAQKTKRRNKEPPYVSVLWQGVFSVQSHF